MRSVRALLIATCLIVPVAAASAGTLPGMTLGEAGNTDVIGQFVCGLPGSTIDGFRAQVNVLVPGGTGSQEYVTGQKNARDLIQKLRNNNDDLTELTASSCRQAVIFVNNVMDAKPTQ
jgi:hypothetical protein